MKPRVLAGLLALLALAAWVLWPEPSAPPAPATEGAEEGLEPKLAEADGAPTSPAESPGAALREASAAEQNQRVLVLDPDGRPLAGAHLWVRTIPPHLNDDLIPYYTENPQQRRPWLLPGRYPAVRTNDQGIADLGHRGAALVGVIEPGMMGAIHFAALEEGAAAEVHTLQLEAQQMVEIHVRDEADRPLTKQNVEVRVANATRLAGLEGEARLTGLPRGGAWEEFGLRARSDDQGRVLLPWQIPDEVRERLGEEQYWRLDATAEIALWGAVRAEADAPPTQPILLRVPSTGTLELELQDFPPGVVPQLVAAEDPHARSLYARQEDLGPVFRFKGVPVAASLRAFFLLREIDPDTQRERLTQRSIPDRLIRGPEAPQQLTRRVLRYERQPGIYGRLILPEHRRKAIASTYSSVNGFSVRGLADRLNYPVQELAFDLYPDGSFHISPRPRYSEGEVKWNELDHLVFEWLPRSFRISDPGPQEERRSLFATVPLQLDGEETHIELGEVTLVEEPYLLHITVLDEQGEPVPGAHVWVERGYEPDRGRAPSRSASPGYLNADQNGECWIQDHDWHSEFGTAPADSRHNHQGAIPFLHVHARREGYAPAMVEIPPSQREVEVRLAAAGSAEGGMRWAEGAHYVQMHWMPVGAPVDDWATGAVARWVGQAMHLNPEDGITSFELDSIPTGQWDVVFSVGIRPSMEAIRIPRVEVRAGEVCRDPRLQEVDLVSTVASYRVKLQDPAGKPVIPPDFRGRLLVRQSEQAFRELARLHWRQGEFLLARPLGVPLEAYLVDDRWLSLDLTGLRPGSHRLTVHPRRDQPVDCGLASPLPDGQLLSVSLQSLQPPRRTSYLTLDASGKGTVQLPAPGEYELGWSAGEGRDMITADGGVVAFTLEQLTANGPLPLRPPTEFLERVRARAD